MNPYLALAIAIAAEVAATNALRASQGFSRLLPSLGVVLGYGLAFYLLAEVLKHFKVGAVYAIWSGVGTAATAVIAWILFEESYNPLALLGIALVVFGVILMNLSGSIGH